MITEELICRLRGLAHVLEGHRLDLSVVLIVVAADRLAWMQGEIAALRRQVRELEEALLLAEAQQGRDEG